VKKTGRFFFSEAKDHVWCVCSFVGKQSPAAAHVDVRVNLILDVRTGGS